MAIITDIETRLRERLSRPGRVQISAKTWSTAYAATGAPKVFESAEALSFAAAWSPIISRTTLIPASLFVMIESSCKAQVTSPTQYYPNGSRTISVYQALKKHAARKTDDECGRVHRLAPLTLLVLSSTPVTATDEIS